MSILLPTAYFPSVGYMAEAIQNNEIVVEAFETYTKQTCRNRCEIFGPNGKQILSVPVIKTNGNHTITKDIQVSTHQPWQSIHWRSIETAYNNSPFFLYYQDEFAHLFQKKTRFLLDLNTEILTTLFRILKIDCIIRFNENFEKSPCNSNDRRHIFGVKNSGQKITYPHYIQVFESRHGFIPALSVLDVLFNLGPETLYYLKSLK
jgi:hypothetical protein